MARAHIVVNTHTYTHTRTHTHTHTQSIFTNCLSCYVLRALNSVSLTHTISISLSYTHTQTLSFLSISLSYQHTLTCAHTHSHTYARNTICNFLFQGGKKNLWTSLNWSTFDFEFFCFVLLFVLVFVFKNIFCSFIDFVCLILFVSLFVCFLKDSLFLNYLNLDFFCFVFHSLTRLFLFLFSSFFSDF